MQMQAGSPIVSELVAFTSNQVVAVEDIEDPTRVQEPMQVEDELAKKPSVDPHSITPDLRIVGSWSDAVTNPDYIQDPPSWCGTTSSNVTASDAILNPQVAHDLEILRVWKENEADNIGHK
ncbi:hypothetical protein A2U01_0056789, partial [Trifolium medium]|nr:hypothetical protein [Trifolium medium]